MAVGLKASVANSLLDALLANGTYTGPAALYVQLHTGSPGAAGTSNVAGNSTRKQITSWAASSGGSKATAADVAWTNVGTAETYAYVSLWDASSSGNFLGDGAITANAVAVGDTFTIASGSLTVTFSVAS